MGREGRSPSDDRPSVHSIPKERGVKRFDEERLIRNFIRSTGLDSSAKILDVGCGFGKKMAWLLEDGYSPQGVDINPKIVETARGKGLDCMTPDEFALTDDVYDLILMAHIVEHFSPRDLIAFLDFYLGRLRSGGYLLISTPLEWADFYADFDHIKVYQIEAFISIMSKPNSQVQYHSHHRVRLVNLGLRRRPWKAPGYDGLYSMFNNTGFWWNLSRGLKCRLSRSIFQWTGGALGGVTTGWVGLFQKEE